MMRYNWRIKDEHPEITADFPFAVVDSKGAAVALVKTRTDAKFIAEAARTISELESTSTRHRTLYLGSLAGRRP